MTRKYSMRCSIASTLDVIGDRWTILILRDLFLHQTLDDIGQILVEPIL